MRHLKKFMEVDCTTWNSWISMYIVKLNPFMFIPVLNRVLNRLAILWEIISALMTLNICIFVYITLIQNLKILNRFKSYLVIWMDVLKPVYFLSKQEKKKLQTWELRYSFSHESLLFFTFLRNTTFEVRRKTSWT